MGATVGEKKNDGGPAFPTPGHVPEGLTKREWFAGMVLDALVSRAKETGIQANVVASEAFAIADRMIEESARNKD